MFRAFFIKKIKKELGYLEKYSQIGGGTNIQAQENHEMSLVKHLFEINCCDIGYGFCDVFVFPHFNYEIIFGTKNWSCWS